jgi:hypothetical protein
VIVALDNGILDDDDGSDDVVGDGMAPLNGLVAAFVVNGFLPLLLDTTPSLPPGIALELIYIIHYSDYQSVEVYSPHMSAR